MTSNLRKLALAAGAMAAVVATTNAQTQNQDQILGRMVRIAQQIDSLKANGANSAQVEALLAEYQELSKSLGGDAPQAPGTGAQLANASGVSNPQLAVAPACGSPITTANFVGGGAGSSIAGGTAPVVVSETVNVSGLGTYLWDVNLNTNITHTFPGDLDIKLISPAGTVVTVSTDNGGASDNVYAGTLWDDSTLAPATDFVYANLVVATPLAAEGRFQAFRGEDPNGVWTLQVSDDAAGDQGNLNSWSLDLSTLAGAPTETTTNFTISPALPLVDLANNDSVMAVATADTYITKVRLYAEVPHTDCSEIDMYLISPAGTVVTVTTDNGSTNDNCFNGTSFDPDAPTAVTDATYANNVVQLLLSPEGGFDAFTGQDPNGNWTLRVFDDSTGDAGSIARWDLDITTASSAPSPSAPAGFGQATGAAIVDPAPVAPVVVTANVSGAGTYLWDVDLTTAISHTSGGDLDMTLTSPAGTVVVISTDNGGVNDDVFNGTLWDDNTTDAATDHVYTNLVAATPLSPEGPLAAFRGEDPNGTWTLTVADDATNDNGTLNSWSLDVSTIPSAPVTTNTVLTSSPALAIVDNTTVQDVINASGLGTSIAGVKLYTEITHTFAGDLDITLISPAGTIVKVTTDNGSGNNDVFNGTTWDPDSTNACTDYAYVNLVVAPLLAPEGTFDNFIGQDPNGAWTLSIADDAGGDTGVLVRWDLVVDTCGAPGPVPYCTPTAPGTSSGCMPTIVGTDNPDVAHSNTCVITVSSVEGQKSGLIFYGLQTTNLQWCAGANTFLCVKAPTQRTPVQATGGTVGACDGSMSVDWNSFQNTHPGALGQPWAAGQHVYVQGWFRDPPSCKTTFLSQALDMTYQP